MTSRRDRGQVLMMVPAGVLILMMLAGIAVDGTQMFLGRQELATAAQAAANDAATFGIDRTVLRQSHIVELNEDRVKIAVERSMAAHGLGLRVIDFRWNVGDDNRTVTVTVTGRVDFVFVKAVPGLPESRTITVQGEAFAQPE